MILIIERSARATGSPVLSCSWRISREGSYSTMPARTAKAAAGKWLSSPADNEAPQVMVGLAEEDGVLAMTILEAAEKDRTDNGEQTAENRQRRTDGGGQRPEDRQTSKQASRQAGRQTDRNTDSQPDSQTDRQIERQTI